MSDVPKKSASAERFAEQSSRIEEQIRETQRRRDEQHFLEELSKRVTIAREGRLDFEKHNYAEAIGKYRRFLSVTARSLNVELSGLKPSLFDEKIRPQECLLISAILLDLCKILDKLKTPSANEERHLYQRLYTAFTIGQPFRGYAAENLRKHILYGKAIQHKAEFWGVYNAIRIKRFCILASAIFGEEALEVNALRNWRDQSLSHNIWGRGFIRVYYQMGPIVLPAIKRSPQLQAGVKLLVNKILRHLANQSSKTL
jgi:hypothetical protein